jgi:hypothetical protein
MYHRSPCSGTLGKQLHRRGAKLRPGVPRASASISFSISPGRFFSEPGVDDFVAAFSGTDVGAPRCVKAASIKELPPSETLPTLVFEGCARVHRDVYVCWWNAPFQKLREYHPRACLRAVGVPREAHLAL